ncbi:MAG: formylglycine-generating enzyme family protein [Victivallales bacterium]|nr:formylglycine-generating enzyme family protein [Victivallales bacterium]
MKKKNRLFFLTGITFWLLAASFLQADVKVADVSVKPRYPWNGLVDITYSIQCGETDKGETIDIYVDFKGYDTVLEKEFPIISLTGYGAMAPVKTGGPYTVTWNAAKDYPTLNSSSFQIRIHATKGMYMVIDLSEGPNAKYYPMHYVSNPPDLNDDTCRTTQLWLRHINAGKFIMGSPSDEFGHNNNDMACHEVTITRNFYIGVFECTQRQWELVMGAGTNPSMYKSDDGCRPVELITYNSIRGQSIENVRGWPQYGHTVDALSFMGKLQAKTSLTFDLPTEAQWEYACRAGTTTALNSGKDWTEEAMKEVQRCRLNQSDGKGGYSSAHTKVGSYPPNAWGLYDMHGNVWEFCLDRWGASTLSTLPEIDPVGPMDGGEVVGRGGSWASYAGYGNDRWACFSRSASRINGNPGSKGVDGDNGFRIVCHLDNP